MDYVGLKSIREAYIDQLTFQGNIDHATAKASKDSKAPLYTALKVHEEQEPSMGDVNYAISDISIDLLALNKEIRATGNKYNNLLTEIQTRLEAVEEQLITEEYRIKDMNTICSNYDDFVSVKTLNYKYFTGSFSYDGNYVFYARQNTTQSNTNGLTILEVAGNGYEGNKYVYEDNQFVQNTLNTSNRISMIDDHISTYYEYSRLTCNKEIEEYPADVNFDNEEAQCTITVYSSQPFGTMKLLSDFNTLTVKDILYSTDNGNTYTTTLTNPIDVNSLQGIYNDTNYAYGSGIICFPSTKYAKIVFSSNGTTTDNIAFFYGKYGNKR